MEPDLLFIDRDKVLVICLPGVQLLQLFSSPLSVAETSSKSLELHELGLGNPLVTCAMVVFEIRMLHINKVTRKYRPFFLRFEINIVVVIKVSLD